jgi:hypothetical protein
LKATDAKNDAQELVMIADEILLGCHEGRKVAAGQGRRWAGKMSQKELAGDAVELTGT